MSGRSTIMMYGGPPRPRPQVKPEPRTTTSDLIPTIPNQVPSFNLAGLHPCLECKRMVRGEVCPFCLRDNFTKMIAALADVTTALQAMSAVLQDLKAESKIVKDRIAAKKRARQRVPANPDRARKKRP